MKTSSKRCDGRGARCEDMRAALAESIAYARTGIIMDSRSGRVLYGLRDYRAVALVVCPFCAGPINGDRARAEAARDEDRSMGCWEVQE